VPDLCPASLDDHQWTLSPRRRLFRYDSYATGVCMACGALRTLSHTAATTNLLQRNLVRPHTDRRSDHHA
jgi:hypothetical protein